MKWFRGKKTLITGGSSGIGKAAALHLVRAGGDVVIAARGAERLDQAVEEIRTQGSGRVLPLVLDVSDGAAVKQAVPDVLAMLGGLDVVINNAGIAHPGHVTEISDQIFDEMMRINYFGTVHVTRAFLDQLIDQRSGSICNVSSVLGFMGIFGYTAYAASKFAVTGFTECLRQEMRPHNIRVSLVFPPDTDTPQLHAENRTKPRETKAIAGNIAMMRPEVVARAMLDGIAAGRYHIVPGRQNKLVYYLYRHFPGAVRLATDADVRKEQRAG